MVEFTFLELEQSQTRLSLSNSILQNLSICCAQKIDCLESKNRREFDAKLQLLVALKGYFQEISRLKSHELFEILSKLY